MEFTAQKIADILSGEIEGNPDIVVSTLAKIEEGHVGALSFLANTKYEEYIYGSADVVGLMCLKVFVAGDEKRYEELKSSAMRLGSAFQKVNFLRDLKHDYETLGRIYFPGINFSSLTNENKKQIVVEIEADFDEAFKGILQLPVEAKFGVYTAFRYYRSLMNKISKTQPEEFLNARIRISNPLKLVILSKSYLRYQFNIIA